VALATLLVLGAPAAAKDLVLEGGGTLTVRPTPFSRILPHAFHDQAMESLPLVFPEHVLHASRRSGQVGEVLYALVCFQETKASARVTIQAVAVHGESAWRVDGSAPGSCSDAVLRALEEVAKLRAVP